jgi:hypothetical protein
MKYILKDTMLQKNIDKSKRSLVKYILKDTMLHKPPIKAGGVR